MAIGTYTPAATDIIHDVDVTFDEFSFISSQIRIVQYDDRLPILAVHLYEGDEIYTVPSSARVSIRYKKPDQTYVYNPALGANTERNIVYFHITQQMATVAGEAKGIVEVGNDSKIAGSSQISFRIEKNPIQEGDIESSDEFKTLIEFVEEAEKSADKAEEEANKSAQSATNAANSASNAASSASAAASSATNAANSANTAESEADRAKAEADKSKNSADAAKESETNAKNSEDNARELVTTGLKTTAWMIQGGTKLAANTDLNSITQIGNYYVYSNADAETISNIPINKFGVLKVEASDGIGGDYIRQTYISGSEKDYGCIYHRVHHESIWRKWHKELKEADGLYLYWSLYDYISIGDMSNKDLNTIQTYGNYAAVSDATAASCTNAPVNRAFILKVQELHGHANKLLQICIEVGEMRIYVRRYNSVNSTWTPWKRWTFDLKNDFTPHTAGTSAMDGSMASRVYSLEGGRKLINSEDLNNLKTVGNYYSNTNELSQSLKNCPSQQAGILKVSYADGKDVIDQRWTAYESGAQFRRIFVGSSWKEWKVFQEDLENNEYRFTIRNNLVENTDLNNVKKIGNYKASNSTVSRTIKNKPPSSHPEEYFVMRIEGSDGGANEKWLRQTWIGGISNETWTRLTSNETWTPWKILNPNLFNVTYSNLGDTTNNHIPSSGTKALDAANLDSIMLLQGGLKIPNNTDLNSLMDIGNYYCPTDNSVKTLKNCPISNAFTMKVFLSTGEHYIAQLLIRYTDHRRYYRYYIVSTGWKSWVDLDYIPNTTPSKETIIGYYNIGVGGGINANGVDTSLKADLTLNSTFELKRTNSVTTRKKISDYTTDIFNVKPIGVKATPSDISKPIIVSLGKTIYADGKITQNIIGFNPISLSPAYFNEVYLIIAIDK